MLDFAEGMLEKLKIIPCEMADYSDLDIDNKDAYQVMINPETVAEKFEVKYSDSATSGSTSAELKFDKILPQTYDLDLLFDSTGILEDPNQSDEAEIKSVPEQIEQFKSVVLQYVGDVHQPRYCVLVWGGTDGDYLFRGRLTNLEITYTLFHTDGTPIRAKAKASFKQSVTKEDQDSEKKDNSPDLTHVRVVKEGDTLPLMTHKIYGDPKYFLEVARVNQLTNFRKLKVGTKIIFPPIDKSVA